MCSTDTVVALIRCDVVRGNGMVRWLFDKVAGKGKVKGKVILGWSCKVKVRGEGKVDSKGKLKGKDKVAGKVKIRGSEGEVVL